MLTTRARSVLLDAGIAPAPDGFALEELEALVRARGWIWTTTPSTTAHGRPGRWRASVLVPACGDFAGGKHARGSRGCGLSEAEALARALATTLAREG